MCESTIEVQVAARTASVLNVIFKQAGATETVGLNSSAVLGALDLFAFTFGHSPGMTYNLQWETTQASSPAQIVVREREV